MNNFGGGQPYKKQLLTVNPVNPLIKKARTACGQS